MIREMIEDRLRPPLESDNRNDAMKLNRLVASPPVLLLIVLVIDLAFFAVWNLLVNAVTGLSDMIQDLTHVQQYIGIEMLYPSIREHGSIVRKLYMGFGAVLLLWDIRLLYIIQVSYSSELLEKGTKGTDRWTTVKEIREQYKPIPMDPSRVTGHDEYGQELRETNYFKGRGGMPVSRWRNTMFIDNKLTNNLFLGATRSGKGELFVFPMIDILSRAEDQRNRPSMIIYDPKLELYKSCFRTLRKREYEVRLINLDNPMKSAGYNPLAIIAEFYKQGRIDEAQQLARSFAFAIFNSNEDSQEAIWKNTATDLWTAMIIAVVDDCIQEDSERNAERVTRFNILRKTFEEYVNSDECTQEGLDWRLEQFAKVFLHREPGEDYLTETRVTEYNDIGIPEYIPAYITKLVTGKEERIDVAYEPIYPAEKCINCFSVLSFFKELVDVESVMAEQGEKAGMKKADTALDDYFNARPYLDYPKALYASIKSSGDRTKGSVYINMQSALSIFMQDGIARLTAESDIDIKDLGFNREHPTVVFLGLPTEDKSNHFLAINFITQVFQYLWKIAKSGTNQTDREVQFIFDEFGNMPVMDMFKEMVTNTLGANMAFNIFIQSYNQLSHNYGKSADTIKGNFGNHFLILTGEKESLDEYSELIGYKTVVKPQRSGTILSLHKSVTEIPEERPLKTVRELSRLREGEVILRRVSKRTDASGAAIRNYPILDEYQDRIHIWWYFWIFFDKIIRKRMVRHDYAVNKDTGERLQWWQEYRMWISAEKRWQGTAFLYRWQYATTDFPNPNEISFKEVFAEKGRESIDYLERVVDIVKVKQKLGLDVSEDIAKRDFNSHKTLADLDNGSRAKYINFCSKMLGTDFRDRLNLNEKMPVKKIYEVISTYVGSLEENERKRLAQDDFLGTLHATLLRNTMAS